MLDNGEKILHNAGDVEAFKRDLIIIMVLMGYSTIFLIASVRVVFSKMTKIKRWSCLSFEEFKMACEKVSGQSYGQWNIEVKSNGYIYIT